MSTAMNTIHPVVAEVTARIIDRSRADRTAYLRRLATPGWISRGAGPRTGAGATGAGWTRAGSSAGTVADATTMGGGRDHSHWPSVVPYRLRRSVMA